MQYSINVPQLRLSILNDSHLLQNPFERSSRGARSRGGKTERGWPHALLPFRLSLRACAKKTTVIAFPPNFDSNFLISFFSISEVQVLWIVVVCLSGVGTVCCDGTQPLQLLRVQHEGHRSDIIFGACGLRHNRTEGKLIFFLNTYFLFSKLLSLNKTILNVRNKKRKNMLDNCKVSIVTLVTTRNEKYVN